MALSDAVSSAVAHWSLGETSGTRSDSVGSNDLTDNNTVGTGTGKFGNAADFVSANSEYLSIADNADVSFGDEDFCISAWVNLDDDGNGYFYSKYRTTGNNREWGFRLSSSRFNWLVTSNGQLGTAVTVDHSATGLPSTGQWYLVVVMHDSVNNEIGISVNGSAYETAATSAGVYDGSAQFLINGREGGADLRDGLVDDMVMLKGYILDSTELSELWDSGNGVAFADWAGGGGGGATPKNPFGNMISGPLERVVL